MRDKMLNQIREVKILMKNIPALPFSLFVVSVIVMNLLANKSISIGDGAYLCLDCGILASWLSFLSMDIITQRFGPKASIEVSIIALLINLLVSIIFIGAGFIPGNWGESYNDNQFIINTALDNTIKGSWYVLMGSSVAFLVSSIVNNILNYLIGKMFKKNPNGFFAYSMRTYVSTFIGQFVDNLTFSLIVSHFFFGWNILQCVICSLTGCLIETLFEIIFSPIGFKIVNRWTKDKVGQEYLDFIKGETK
jgi:uncharacterized PurR-regulated membrane protein YhhQ (DUF165 family)